MFIDFQRIFHGISVKSNAPLAKAYLIIRPVNRKIDKLSFVGDGNAYRVRAVIRNDWVMEISNLGTDVINNSTSTDWNQALNYPAYKLNIDVSSFKHFQFMFWTLTYQSLFYMPL